MHGFPIFSALVGMSIEVAAGFTMCRERCASGSSCTTGCCAVVSPAWCCSIQVYPAPLDLHTMCLDNSSLVGSTTMTMNGNDPFGGAGNTYVIDVENVGNGTWKGGFDGRPSALDAPYYNNVNHITISGLLLKCEYIKSLQGEWKIIQSSSGSQMLSYEVGISRSYDVESSTMWGASATATMKAGFDAFGASASTTISGTLSGQVSQTYSSTMGMSDTTTHSFNFDAGVVWQWQFTATDVCGVTVAPVDSLALTENALEPPCCLPNYFANASVPTGDCAGDTPNLCQLGRQQTSSISV